MSSHTSPLQQYQAALQQGFVADSAQQLAVQALQQCFEQLVQGIPAQGIYLWGPVGRGKTWLMDSFYSALQAHDIPSRRQHFHHFMAWLHHRLFELSGIPAPLQHVAMELAEEIRVLCFDEFFINDIGDAMLLGPLLQALLEKNLVLVATSNQPPHRLYEFGFNRDRILPALAALQAHMQVLPLDGGQDHRLHASRRRQRYWVTAPDQPASPLEAIFQQLTDQPASPARLDVESRPLEALGMSNGVLWCTYSALCEAPWSAQDYMALCQRFQHILLSDIPCLSAPVREQYIARGTEDAAQRVNAGDRQLTALSTRDNGVRRFIALVDECYDQAVPLWLEAAVPLLQLYTEGALLFPFQRTQSRLQAMQNADFGL